MGQTAANWKAVIYIVCGLTAGASEWVVGARWYKVGITGLWTYTCCMDDRLHGSYITFFPLRPTIYVYVYIHIGTLIR